MADNYMDNNPFAEADMFVEMKKQRQEEEALRLHKEELENQRKLNVQRILANKTSNELGKILSMINPELSVLGYVMGTTTEFAKHAYSALDEMSTKLSKVSASAKLLGVNIDGLEGASELQQDIREIETVWKEFIDQVEVSISNIYYKLQDEEKLAGMSNDEIKKENAGNIFKTAFSSMMVGTNPLLAGLVVASGIKQEQIVEELSTRVDKEEEVNKELEKYSESLKGVAGANDSIMKQITNISNNGSSTRNDLLGLASSGITGLSGAGVNNNVDQNRWTSLMLGYTDKIYRDMNGSVDYKNIYEDVMDFFVNGKMDGINKYGIGLTEESLFGYANQYKNMDLKNYTYREDKLIETRFDFYDEWINASDENKEAMYDLGYEIKNNTNAIQKWQWLETINNASNEKGSSNYKNYFAVDKNGNDITDQVFGDESKRFNDQIRENIKKMGDTSRMTIDEILTASGMKLPTIGNWSNNAVRLDDLVSNNVTIPNTKASGSGITLDQLVANNMNKEKEEIKQSIQLNVSASDNLKVEIAKTVADSIFDTINQSFTGGNVASGVMSLPMGVYNSIRKLK